MEKNFNQSFLYKTILSAITLWVTILCTSSHADTGTATMSVSATVRHTCLIGTTTMAFGTYDGVVTNASSALNATATIISSCTSGAAALITMNAGDSARLGSDETSIRRMTSKENDYLVYQVYSDVARRSVWENNAPTGIVINGIGSPQTYRVYGSIPSGQIVPEGYYNDQIIITITY